MRLSMNAISVKTEAVETPICGPKSLGSIQKTTDAIATIRLGERRLPEIVPEHALRPEGPGEPDLKPYFLGCQDKKISSISLVSGLRFSIPS